MRRIHRGVQKYVLNRADPFNERDATGWQFMNMHTGRVDLAYNLYNNDNRNVVFDSAKGHPTDTRFQSETSRIAPQKHY